MALPDYSDLIRGTSLTWKNSGGDKVLTLTSLTNNSGREGDKSGSLIDGTYGLPEFLEILVTSSVGSAATNGLEIEFYIGESDSATAGTNNPANLTGADAGLSNPDELKFQCHFLGSLVFSNARGTNVQKQRFRYRPLNSYIVPLVVNKTGQTLGSTASDHTFVVTPYYRRILD